MHVQFRNSFKQITERNVIFTRNTEYMTMMLTVEIY